MYPAAGDSTRADGYGSRFYTVDMLNDQSLANSYPQALVFQGPGGNTKNAGMWTIAFEDKWLGPGGGSDRDYNDQIVIFGNLRAVPEPGAYPLMGTVAAALACRRRKRA